MGIGCSLQTFVKHHGSSCNPVCPKTGPVLSKNLVRSVLKPGPFCPGTWSVLSWNVVRFVLKRGPFCTETWSVLSLDVVRFVLKRGPFCPETWSVLSGPFCPWSVLSEYLSRDA